MTKVEELTAKLLEQGGLKINDDKRDPISQLEAWLALPDATSIEGDSDLMEDAAPFEYQFYRALEELLIQAWKPESFEESSSQPNMLHSNPFLDLDHDPKEMSLYEAMESVRITRLLRHWMELNVLGNDLMLNEDAADDTEKSSLSRFLLKEATVESRPGIRGRTVYRLIQALYYHVEQLPSLQSQINYYTQSLMRSDRTAATSGKAVTDTQSRLDQYKETQDVSARLNQQWEEHVDALEYIVGEWYATGSVDIRRQSRAHLGSVWTQFVSRSGGGLGSGVTMENTTSSGIPMTLAVLHRILKGTHGKLHKSHEHLLNYHLIPLHRPSSMVLWRDQTSLLELYHEPLVQCIAILLQKKPEWIPNVIASLLEPEVWNKGGNTPKLVLLLHEIDTYIGILPNVNEQPDFLGETWPKLLRVVGGAMASDHSRLAERALTFLKTKNFLALVQEKFEQSLQILLPFLVKNEPPWNPTVRKMTYNILKTLLGYDEKRFLKVSDQCFPSGGEVAPPVQANQSSPTKPKKEGIAKMVSEHNGQTPASKDFSLKSAMGGWKPPGGKASSSQMPPPSSRAPRSNGKAPPLGVTGVAPWNMKGTPPNIPAGRGDRKNPPLGVTGVAPWAMKQKLPPGAKRSVGQALADVAEESSANNSTPDDGEQPKHRVLAYMEQIKPAEQQDGVSSWSKTQMAETPTLLPNLKFHDLVFGHDLGTGAFGSVRYARLIDKGKTRSQWPEYAVKIISTEKIKEVGYEASVQREVAVLRVLSHPGIARLVSSFRFREGMYLVLEYASGGDLHSLLRKNGSLDHDSTRFVMGEIVAAISSIHEVGLIYADLKPENIVITESGHVKLTDFGGCRPFTKEGKELIDSVSTNLLKDLRDGDWKSFKGKAKSSSSFEMNEDEDEDKSENGGDSSQEFEHEQDLRIEGTTAYLPPEVVMGSFPTTAADSWALGCVIYQCLSGRPPILEADESRTRNRIVSFDVKSNGTNHDEDKLFGEDHASAIEPNARSLIVQLLNRHAMERPTMQQVASHDFFVSSGTDVFTLYRQAAAPLDVGDVTPVADAQWTRRQFSSIWAPQPQAYDISLNTGERQQSRGLTAKSPISEGAEGNAFFSKSTRPMDLRNVSEGKLPPIPNSPIVEE